MDEKKIHSIIDEAMAARDRWLSCCGVSPRCRHDADVPDGL